MLAADEMTTAMAQALDQLTIEAEFAAPHELAEVIDRCGRRLGARSAVPYVVDLQQHVLQPLVPADPAADMTALSVDATLAGRAYQTLQGQSQDEGDDATRLWLPLQVGTHRLGVMAVVLDRGTQGDQGLLAALTRLAVAAAGLLASKSYYGDTIVRLRRSNHLGVAAELHYSILPPLSFASHAVTVSAALEPCYEVAGDAIDYSVDPGHTQVAIFDGMGHGLHSAQCAVFTVAAYRSARRAGLSLIEVMDSVDDALVNGLGGELFTTSVLADLDTTTGLLRWVNAGHPSPLLVRGGKVIKSLETEPRPPLGLGHLLAEDKTEIGREQLEPGDMILLYTDGVVEARAPDGEFFGVERLSDLVSTQLAGGLTAPETMRRVCRELLVHHQGQLTDDATLLMLEWRSQANPPATPLTTHLPAPSE